MKKIGKFFLGLLIFISSFTWEIIQCALGLICTIYCILASMGKKVLEFRWYKGEILVFGEFNSTGVSLGRFIILDYRYKTQTIYGKQMIQYTIDHEYGHTRQSLMLGPLYLIVVGLPSALHNLYNRTLFKDEPNKQKRFILREKEYYNWYCEKWADKLGNVDRSTLYEL